MAENKNIRIILPDVASTVYVLMAVKLLAHLAVNISGGYGFFRDEFYYIACSDHLALGYVDQPPLSIYLLWLSRLLFGDALWAIRLLPALAGALTIIITGLTARQLGGGKNAQTISAAAALAAPLYLGMNSIFSMNSFDILFWALAIHRFILILEKDNRKDWILLGIILGLGLMNKLSVLWLIAGLITGLLFSNHRKKLISIHFAIAAAVTMMIFIPHIIWQVKNGFPTLEFMHNASSGKYKPTSPLGLFLGQILNMNPMSLPVWLSGLAALAFFKTFKPFRVLAVVYFTVFIILAVNGTSKVEYISPAFPMLFAAGAVVLEGWFQKRSAWIKSLPLALLLIGTIVLSPLAIAILPVESYIAYSTALGKKPSTPEKKKLGRLPQFYADMFGWEDMVKEISKAYNSLTTEQKKQCALLANNYGQAGAIDFYGPKYNLPKAICGHNNYWLWGSRDYTGKVVIRIGGEMSAIMESYDSAKTAGYISNPYCMPYENNQAVIICFSRKRPLSADWAEFRHYE